MPLPSAGRLACGEGAECDVPTECDRPGGWSSSTVRCEWSSSTAGATDGSPEFEKPGGFREKRVLTVSARGPAGWWR